MCTFLFTTMMGGIVAGVGNLVAEGDKEKIQRVFGEDAVTEDMGNISETSDVSSGRLYFEQHYPVILPAGFSVEQRGLPDGGNMIEKELIVK